MGHFLEFLLGTFWFIRSTLFWTCWQKAGVQLLVCCTLPGLCLCRAKCQEDTEKKAWGLAPPSLDHGFTEERKMPHSKNVCVLHAHGSLGAWGVRGEKNEKKVDGYLYCLSTRSSISCSMSQNLRFLLERSCVCTLLVTSVLTLVIAWWWVGTVNSLLVSGTSNFGLL